MANPPRRRKTARAVQYANPTFQRMRDLLGANLKRMRAARGWTMEEAADRCGMRFPTYHPIEAGKGNATLVTLARLCDGFHVEPWHLWQPPLPELPPEHIPEEWMARRKPSR
jgi:transcriptional regulator with XRE-family HTH domain